MRQIEKPRIGRVSPNEPPRILILNVEVETRLSLREWCRRFEEWLARRGESRCGVIEDVNTNSKSGGENMFSFETLAGRLYPLPARHVGESAG